VPCVVVELSKVRLTGRLGCEVNPLTLGKDSLTVSNSVVKAGYLPNPWRCGSGFLTELGQWSAPPTRREWGPDDAWKKTYPREGEKCPIPEKAERDLDSGQV